MADVRWLYAEQTDAARVAMIRGDRVAAAAAFRAAVDLARGEPSLEPQVVSALVHLGKLEQELGQPVEAERLLTEALDTGERCFGAEHPSLAAVLNELSRLHIRQSQHARAEVVLERLLRITRAKGEQHPDVATALAGLALVKRALGDNAGAERRFRDALRIRERALAPQHMATVVTMEQLSETCAARGNRSEALALLQRALPTREAALGADHATVHALKSRIAALEVQTPEAALASIARQLASLTPPDALVETAPLASSSAAVVEMAEPAPETVTAPAASIPSLPTEAAHALPGEASRHPRRSRVALFASAGVTAVALATVGLGAYSLPDFGGIHTATTTGIEARFASAAATRIRNGAAKLGVATMEAVLPNASRSPSDISTGIVQAGMPMSASAAPAASPKLPAVPKALAAVTARLIANTNVDSLVRASTKLDRALATDQIGTSGSLLASHLDDASASPAVLIAPAPLPRFPDELHSQRSEGEVDVRFRVDERGRVDVSSMKVLKSDHELFTAAVRSVLPRFRFQPARSAAPESKPIADWVDFHVKFATK
jgi:TonB family protein